MKSKKRTIAAIIAVVLVAALLAGVLIPALSSADSMYIIPDSNTRELTYNELWDGYRYDTLMYAYNEILARHGYKFEYGSRCYNWFTQMPWYSPNENESSSNHSATYRQMSKLENQNFDLIKQVYRDMRNAGYYNPGGKGLPTPPAYNVNKPRGFEFVDLKPGQKLAVYSAPYNGAYRANNGKATCSTNGAVYAKGYDNGWMLMLYEANHAGQYRVGYVYGAKFNKGARDNLEQLVWDERQGEVLNTVSVTDDPALTGAVMTTLYAGEKVTYLTTMFNTDGWDYIETTVDGQTARGFIPQGNLSVAGEDPTEEIDPDEDQG